MLSGLKQTDEHIQDEIFGPVMTVQKFKDDAQHWSGLMTSDMALASSVWTTNHTRAMRFAKYLDFGTVWVNTHIPLAAEMPHGGFKHSGYGKDLSHLRLRGLHENQTRDALHRRLKSKD